MERKRLVLVGGGRWGRVHASVLSKLAPRLSGVLWVTSHDKASVTRALADMNLDPSFFSIVDSLDAALTYRPDAAIVANATEHHFETSLRILRAGIPALVEKPIALGIQDGEELIDAARRQDLVLCVGLHLFYARYLQAFRQAWEHRKIARIGIDWFDCATEIRHGELKVPNLSIDKANDIVPHVWSLIRLMHPHEEPSLSAAQSMPMGGALLHMAAGEVTIEARLTRRAAARKRTIEITFADDGKAKLDFTLEPGAAELDGNPIDISVAWTSGPRPLAAEIVGFLDAIEDLAATAGNPQIAEKCRGAVTLAAAAKYRLEISETAAIASHGGWDDIDSRTLIIDSLCPSLTASGYRISVGDRVAADRIVNAVRHYVGAPWPIGVADAADSFETAILAACSNSRFVSLLARQLAQRAAPQKPTAASPRS